MSITPCAYGDQHVRVVTINDEPWLVGTDVARCLGYANPTDALGRVHPDDKQTATLALSEGSRTVARDRTLVNLACCANERETADNKCQGSHRHNQRRQCTEPCGNGV